MIRFENVSKHFVRGNDTVRALDGVSFEVPRGAFALIAGPSGSGKTTLINIAAGLTVPTSGAVTVASERLDQVSARRRSALRAKHVAVVFQMFHLVPYLTGLENVLLPTLASAGTRTQNAAARARTLFTELSIEHRAQHFPHEMSVGEQQRCALARALLNAPEVILADEPTGNLDPESAQRVMKALTSCHEKGATVLLVSHQDIGVATDVVLRLREGRLQA